MGIVLRIISHSDCDISHDELCVISTNGGGAGNESGIGVLFRVDESISVEDEVIRPVGVWVQFRTDVTIVCEE